MPNPRHAPAGARSRSGPGIASQPAGQPPGWLRSTRERLGWSRRMVAEKLRVSPAAVRDYEQGELEETISLRTLRRAAHALGCELIIALVPTPARPAPAAIRPAVRPARRPRVISGQPPAPSADGTGELESHLK